MVGLAIKTERLSKHYRLGVVNHGMLYMDLQSLAARVRGRPDPNSKIGSERSNRMPAMIWALRNLDLVIEEGDRVGIIGRNGAGKSTLLRILSRITAPTEGIVKIRGRVTSLLEVGTGFHPELSGRENIYLNGAIQGMRRREITRKLDEIVAFSEIGHFLDTPVKRYSSGMYIRLAFAVVAHLDSDILLADEVLAVGDLAFQRKCLGKMEEMSKKQGRTVVFVSHQLNAISELCTKAIVLERGSLAFSGSVRDGLSRYLASSAVSETMQNENDASQDLALTGLRITGADGVEVSSVPIDRDFCIEIDYQVNRELSGAYVALHLYSPGHLLLIDSCDVDSHPEFLVGRSPGLRSFRVVIPGNLLNQGRYDVEAWAGIPKRKVKFSQTPLFHFEVVDTGSVTSRYNATRECLLAVPLRWESLGG
ncbi:MAG: polysaccharide ABC transporter ATP-binding protein [Rectinemataceae bacterium]